jgi:hypothetical protein
VDGENVSRSHAAELLREAASCGAPSLRVYGAAEHISGWEDEGFLLCPTRPGKNAADLLLCVEAMRLALHEGFRTILIASSDRDFSCLAEGLRALGITVIGLGGAKAARSFRTACSTFREIAAAPGPAPPKPTVRPDLLARVSGVVRGGGKDGVTLVRLGNAMTKAGVQASSLPAQTRRAWLSLHPQVFDLDPKGPEARVRLRQAGTP